MGMFDDILGIEPPGTFDDILNEAPPKPFGQTVSERFVTGRESQGVGTSVATGRSPETIASDLKDTRQFAPSGEESRYQAGMAEKAKAFTEAPSWAGAWDVAAHLFSNKKQLAGEVAQSVGSSIPAFGGAIAGAAAGSVVPGVGTVVGGIVGFLLGNLASNVQGEISQNLTEKLAERGVDITNTDAVTGAIKADPTMLEETVSRSLKRGGATAAVESVVDVATLGMGKILKPATSLASRMTRLGGAVGAQGAAEGLGSMAADVASGDPVDVGQALTEGVIGTVAEGPVGIIQLAVGKSQRTPQEVFRELELAGDDVGAMIEKAQAMTGTEPIAPALDEPSVPAMQTEQGIVAANQLASGTAAAPDVAPSQAMMQEHQAAASVDAARAGEELGSQNGAPVVSQQLGNAFSGDQPQGIGDARSGSGIHPPVEQPLGQNVGQLPVAGPVQIGPARAPDAGVIAAARTGVFSPPVRESLGLPAPETIRATVLPESASSSGGSPVLQATPASLPVAGSAASDTGAQTTTPAARPIAASDQQGVTKKEPEPAFSQNAPPLEKAPDGPKKGAAQYVKASIDERVERVKHHVDKVKAKWKGAPDMVVLPTINEAPEAVRKAAEKGQGAVEGFVHEGKVYVVADQLTGEADVRRVALHETLGHHGLRKTFGPELGKVLDLVAKMRPGETAMRTINEGADPDSQDGRRVGAEELLAYMAQKNPELSLVKRAVVAIRQALRKMGFDMKLTDAEIIKDYILPARRTVEQGNRGAKNERQEKALPAKAVDGGGAGFSRKAPDTPEFRRFIKDSKVVDEKGAPLVMYHGSRGGDITRFSPITYFTDDATEASDYANSRGAVYPVYVSIKKPYESNDDQDGENRSELTEWEEADVAALAAEGYDGVIGYRNGVTLWAIPISPSQVKSATGNTGAFDPKNPDVRFSRAAEKKPAASVDEQLTDLTADKRLAPVKVTVKAIVAETGREVTYQESAASAIADVKARLTLARQLQSCLNS